MENVMRPGHFGRDVPVVGKCAIVAGCCVNQSQIRAAASPGIENECESRIFLTTVAKQRMGVIIAVVRMAGRVLIVLLNRGVLGKRVIA